MLRLMQRATHILTVVLVSLVAATASSQKLPTGSDILEKIQRGTEGVQDYVVDLSVSVDMERMQIPRSNATMYFKKPDKVHFESSSIAIIPREGMAFNSSAILARYTAETIGPDTANGKNVIKMQLAAKEATARLRQLFAWVDPSTWTVSRIQTIPYEGRLLAVDFSYGLQEGKYWLPVALTARFEVLGQTGERKQEPSSATPDNPLDQMQARTPRSGSVSIEYSNYRINTGLSDKIFESTEKKQ